MNWKPMGMIIIFFIGAINPLIKPCCVKWQVLYHSVSAYGGFVCERSSTHAAHVRLLSCVDSLMSLQGVELSELLITVLTMIRPFTCEESRVKTGGSGFNDRPYRKIYSNLWLYISCALLDHHQPMVIVINYITLQFNIIIINTIIYCTLVSFIKLLLQLFYIINML